MAKTRQATLIWLQEEQQYRWRDEYDTNKLSRHEEPEAWLKRLTTYTSFAFHGREGKLTLLKEARPRGGDGYWYAYRRQGKRIAKKYAGRSGDLTTERLEQMAMTLKSPSEQILPASATENTDNSETWQETEISKGHHYSISTAPYMPLLTPKFHLPPLHTSLIQRERLLTLLDRVLEHRLTLLSAPAGSGKTTLVCQWVAERKQQQHIPPIAWVSLDNGDNDPIRFWRYLMTACQIFDNAMTQEALLLLQSMPQPPFEASIIETAITIFLNILTQCEQGGILILDDYQTITAPRIQQTMTFFLTYLPTNIHLVLITRHDPPFSLAQLRARNELSDIRSSDLRFTQAETSMMLQQALPVSLTPEIAQRVNDYLEGWAAGLRLLLITLRTSTSPREIELLLRVFAGGQQALQEYFLTEVFNSQPAALQRFLLQSSVLGSLTGSLCTAITGEPDSERMLEMSARANLFLEPLTDITAHQPSTQQWYRYHGLFAEAMRAEARRTLGEEKIRALSTQASYWYEEHHLYTEAVESALHAQDYGRAAILIERIQQEPHIYSQSNEYHTLHNWLEQLPETILTQHPALCLGYARAVLFIAGSWLLTPATLALLEKLFRMAEESYRAEQNLPRLGEVLAFRALAAWRQDDAPQAAGYARQALLWLPAEQHTWRSLSLSVIGKVELIYQGQVVIACKMLEEAYALCEATDYRHFRLNRTTVNMFARGFFERGELHRSYEYYQEALHKAREGYAHNDDMAHTLFGLARIAYEQNELETAWQQAEEVQAIGQYLAMEFHEVHTILLLTRIQLARGETMAARQRLDALLTRIPATQAEPAWPLAREIQIEQTRLALADGDLIAVQRWIAGLDQSNKQGLFSFTIEKEMLMLARGHLAQGKTQEAVKLLENLLREAQAAGRVYSTFEIQALLALTYAANAQPEKARSTLQMLLEETCTEGYMRLFLNEGDAMATLLRSLVLHIHEQPLLIHLQNILHAFPGSQEATTLLPEPLSIQEQRVLHLLVPGYTNAEIASELVVSVNTVRTHIQNIYRKLDVHNRTAAITVARQFHLIP